MRPPICDICHKRLDTDEGGLLQFALSEDDKEFNKRFEEPGFTGHPRGLHWLCDKHHAQLKAFSHYTWAQALKEAAL
ncbi:MAG: hypothetical protein MUF42_11280 [Cytophagaceae bacterium]|jgi:hypothetical protein|nr:hypothetical protein [Cytophagaceae bacterium]